ncbi:MAG TPA: hypothetical protein VFS16_13285 [Acidimicrobiia bacterium]|nr:hypothetical protein [Acidimicrobiia bacterium]
MRIPRTVKTVTASALAAGTIALSAVQPATAESAPVAERYAARAGAQVAEISLLGRSATFGSALTDSSLEAVGRQLSATATGTGTGLAPATRSVARFGDATATGGTNCARPPLDAALADARSTGKASDVQTLPVVDVAPACGGASVTGDAGGFAAESIGGHTQMGVKLSDTLQSVLDKATAGLAPATLATPVGDLVSQDTAGNAEAAKAVGALNTVLGGLVPGVALPSMEPRQTVGSLLQRLGTGDLLRIDLARATARNSGDAGAYLAEALSEGGVIEILPGFRGAGTAPLLRLSITRSRAAVPVMRSSMQAAPTVENAVVRVESDALGGGLPLDRLVSGSALRSGAGFVEVGPGQALSVLCDGPVAPLCSEISVSAAKAPVVLPNGATRAESSTVTAHLFKGMDSLAPGTNLATALAQPAVVEALEAAVPGGAPLGIANGIPGVRVVSGGVVAEAGGARVLGAQALQVTPSEAPTPELPVAAPAPVKNLPHTGGQPFSPLVAPALLGASVALGRLARRRRA